MKQNEVQGGNLKRTRKIENGGRNFRNMRAEEDLFSVLMELPSILSTQYVWLCHDLIQFGYS
jgi:hypothetical protein